MYYQFLRNGRWKHEDESIYSEVELSYNIALVKKQIYNLQTDKDCQGAAVNKDDLIALKGKFFDKTMHTMGVLMN